MATQVDLSLDGPVARITLRGEKGIQILSAETRRRLLETVAQVATSDCSVVVFVAEGRTFIAGASIDELRSLDEAGALRDSRAGQQLMSAIEDLPQTTIAAIHGAKCRRRNGIGPRLRSTIRGRWREDRIARDVDRRVARLGWNGASHSSAGRGRCSEADSDG